MKKRNGWCYAFWILIMVVLILALMVGLIAWGGSRNEDEVEEGNDVTVSSVSISPTEMSLKMGETEEGTLTATVTMSDGTTSTSETVSWTSSNSSVASVTETGYTASVTALKAGTTEITASVGTVTSAECTVTVAEADPATVTDVTISGTLALAYGDETGTTLTATVTMSDGSDYEGDYVWSSDDEEKVVKVTDNGKTATVMPVSCGEAKITVAVDDNMTDTCTVTVSEDHTAAEAGRITGSADVADDYHFMFDETYSQGTTVVFDDSAVSAEYDADTKTYTLNGISGVMDEDQGPVFSSIGTHVGCEYIGFIVNVDQGEMVVAKSYSGEGATASEFALSYGDDTSFLIDLTNHGNDGAWYMELDVTYAGGDVETYYVVLGEIFTPASTAADLEAVFESGGDVALVSDISVTGPVQVAAGVEVELDLAGHTIGLSGSSGYISYTIGVLLGGELTIIDSSEDGSGVVDTVGNNTAALINVGTTTLKGGLFTRSAEDGMEETRASSITDSFYTVVNIGDMVIEDGATVYNAGDYSSCLINSNGSEVQAVYPNDRTESAKLTVNGGKIYGGKYSIRNGDSGELVMTGGTVGGLRGDTDALPYRALNNYDDATITGGTLLGGNGGAFDVNAGGHANNCTEGVVIFNEDGGTEHTLTIGDENGNGPEIIYEGINPNAETDDDGNQPAGARLSYYDEVTGNEIPDFATGIAVYSGEVNVLAGTIECNDDIDDDERDYTFTGVYLTNGSLNVSGGKISGDYAVVIDHTAEADAEISFAITGGEIGGDVILYFTDENGDTVASVYTPGGVIVPSEEFEFNDEAFDGFSGLDEDGLKVKDESGEDVTYTAGGITVTVTVGSDGSITYVVDGIVANQMSDEQKVAFDASYETDPDGTIRFYIAVQVAVQPGETVTVTGGGETETVPNDTDEVIYDLWVIEIGQNHFTDVTAETVGDYLVVDISSFTMTVSVTNLEGNAKGSYTVTFGNVFVPLQAWRCANDQHTVSSWTVVEEETCGTDGYQVGVCDYCGEEVTEIIPANGLHTATVYSDGNMYAVYTNTAAEDAEAVYAWCALCEVCGEWFVIDECKTCDIYDFVLVAKDEDSLNAAIKIAGEREDDSETNRTQILVYGEIEISEGNYVSINCDNVEIYGLGVEESKIIDSAYDGANPDGKDVAMSGVEISGKNVTIRNLTIDGTALNDVNDEHTYKHALEIKGGAENVLISGCVVIGGGTDLETDSSICIMEATGIVKIENSSLSGAHNGLVIEHGGQDIDITVSGGKIDAIRPIWIDGGHGVTLLVEDAEIYGRNSFGGEATSIKFSNCTFGFHISDSGYIAYGAVSTYGDVTLEKCTFLPYDTGTNLEDFPVKNSNNYAIQARQDGVTITIIDCEFENTHDDLDIGKLAVDKDNIIYIIAYLSYSFNVVIGDSEDALEYIYDSTSHAVEHNHIWVAGEEDETTGKTTYTCVCGETKTEVTGNHVVSATPSVGYIVTTVEGTVSAPEFAIVMSEGTSYTSISDYLTQSEISDSITWSSSDASVATVDATTGEVTILGTGTTVITVKFEITELEASYTIYVGEAIEETDPLIGSWYGEDKVTASVSFISLNLTVEVYVTVTENTFTLRVVESAMSIDETIWNNVAWFKADNEYYIVVEEADGSYELIDISYSNDSGSEQLTTSFEFTFQYKLGITMDVDVVVENATMARVTEDEDETPEAEEEPDGDGDDGGD